MPRRLHEEDSDEDIDEDDVDQEARDFYEEHAV